MHRRLGHISEHMIHAIMRTNTITGLQLIDYDTPFMCDSCAASKSTWKEIYTHRCTPIASAFGDEIYSDIWVSPLESLGGRQYYVTFINDHMCYLSVDFLWAKSDTLEAYKAYTAWVHTQFGICIKHFHSDCGGEYTGDNFTSHLHLQGMVCHLTTADTP